MALGTRVVTLVTLATASQQARMVRGSRRPFPPRRRAYESIPCATRPDAPLPASTTCRKRKVSSSCGVRIRGPHSMHWPRPGESFWALKCATRGASRGQTNPVCVVGGSLYTSGATSVSWFSQHTSVSWCSPSVSWYSGRASRGDPHDARCLFIGNPDFTPMPHEGHRDWFFSRGTDMTRPSEEGGGCSCTT